MKKKAIILICCLVAVIGIALAGVFGTKNKAEDGVTRCLLIGCDRFVSMPGTEPASVNNVNTMAALLRDFMPEGARMFLQMNGPGTVAEFVQLVEDAFGNAKKGDVSLIYLSTHGILIQNDDTGAGKTGLDVALLLSDGEEEERLSPEVLRKALDKVPGKKILILDACHSGAVIGGGWEAGNPFEGSGCMVLVSSGALEDSWFWNSETDEYTGTGYFTAAMDRALRASDPEQIDPNSDGEISLKEVTERLRGIHGASTVYCYPEGSRETIFRIPADRKTGARLQGVSFGETALEGDAVILPIRFRAGESIRVMYQLAPGRNGKWDFEHAVRLPDKEKTGLIRGLVSPGEKERKIRLTVGNMGEDGNALMQIVTYYGDNMTPSVEAGTVISINNSELQE